MRGRWSAECCKVRGERAGVIKGALGRHSALDMRMQREHARTVRSLEVVVENVDNVVVVVGRAGGPVGGRAMATTAAATVTTAVVVAAAAVAAMAAAEAVVMAALTTSVER